MSKKLQVKNQFTGDKIINAREVLKQRGEIMDTVLRNVPENSRLEELIFPLKHFGGAYVFNDGKIIHGERVENSIYYYSPDNSFYCSRYKDEALISEKYTVDNHSGRRIVATHILTRQPLYAVKKNREWIFEHNGLKVIEFTNQNKDILSDGVDTFMDTKMVPDGYSYYKRNSYNKYKKVFRKLEDGDYKDISSNYTEVISLFYPKEAIKKCDYTYGKSDYSVEDVKLFREDKISEFNNSCSVYLKDDIFYFINQTANCYSAVLVSANQYNKMKYCIVANTMFYYSDTDKGASTINSIYTTKIGSKFIMFDENFKLVFRDTPYHKFGAVQGNCIIKEDTVYNLDFTNTIVQFGSIKESDYSITNNAEGEAYLINDIFVILKDGQLSLFYKTETSDTENVLKSYKNLRFQRKKSYFYLNETSSPKEVLIYTGTDNAYKITEEDFVIKSLKLISERAAIINGHDGKLYCVNFHGYKIEISPFEEYEAFYGDSNIAGLKKDGSIEINSFNLSFIQNELRVGNDIIWPNVRYNGDLVFNSIEPVENCESYISIDLKYALYSRIVFDGEPLYQDEYLDCYSNSIGMFAYSKNGETEIPINNDELDKITNNSSFVSTKRGYLIKGYSVQSNLLSMVERYNHTIYKTVVNIISLKNISSKEELESLIFDVIMNEVVKNTNEYGINITVNDIKKSLNIKDILLVLLNIENIKHNCPIPFSILVQDIEMSLKNPEYNFTGTSFFKSSNSINHRKFMEHGLSIDKFNNFTGEVSFKSTTAKNRLQKETLSGSLFNQIYNLIGSRKKSISGVFQLTNLECLNDFGRDINEDILSYIETLSQKDRQVIIKVLNKCGYRLYGTLKKHLIEMDYTNFRIIVNKRLPEKIAVSKFKQIAEDVLLFKDKAIEEIENNLTDDVIRGFVVKYVNWSLKHIKDDFSSIQSTIDFKEKNFLIKLWDRKNIMTNLVQGNKTHCCIATDSFNIGALVNYIYNENLVLVEIRSNNDIVGQAFVYLAVSDEKLLYRYENRYHLFMMIDNVEMNNNYTQYSEDIAKNLQKFMSKYAEYVNSNISDILLGTNYNDITPPYNFKADFDLIMLGTEHYTDSKYSFYKFI